MVHGLVVGTDAGWYLDGMAVTKLQRACLKGSAQIAEELHICSSRGRVVSSSRR
jgi:hypothetical protein